MDGGSEEDAAVRALIVGAGSVGLGVASCLLKSGWQVHLVGRPATCAALAAHGWCARACSASTGARRGPAG